MPIAFREQIDEFLRVKRLALVGVSRNPQDFSRKLFEELRTRGYDVVPVNPNTDRIEDTPCYPRVSSIEVPVEAALLMNPNAQTASVCDDCIAARVPRVWMYCAIGSGAVDQVAAERCRRAGMDVIEGHCPFMFLKNTAWYHGLHAGVLVFFGSYPPPMPVPKTKSRKA